MSWKKGPLPAETYGWGGVVSVVDSAHEGFYFADFQGDHVVLPGLSGRTTHTLKANEVAAYDNSLELPPKGFATIS